jgi:uncharacterized protein (TIGR02246 family)
MKPQLHIAALLLLGYITLPSIAAETPAVNTPEATIRKAAVEYVTAFNKANAKDIATLWTRDGDYVNEAGTRFVGREAIQAEYETFFQQRPGATIQVTVDSVRLLGPDSAIEDGRAVVTSHLFETPATSRYVAIHVRKEGTWRLASVRDTRVESTSNHSHLGNLEWLIGDWIAEHEGVKLEVNSRWIANDTFIERNYTLTKLGKHTGSGRQIVGWDPATSSVRSWVFTSDGGHAIGTWSQHPRGWIVRTSGVTGAGEPTSTTNIITRETEKTLSWKSINRSVGGSSLPDTGETMLERK